MFKTSVLPKECLGAIMLFDGQVGYMSISLKNQGMGNNILRDSELCNQILSPLSPLSSQLTPATLLQIPKIEYSFGQFVAYVLSCFFPIHLLGREFSLYIYGEIYGNFTMKIVQKLNFL